MIGGWLYTLSPFYCCLRLLCYVLLVLGILYKDASLVMHYDVIFFASEGVEIPNLPLVHELSHT